MIKNDQNVRDWLKCPRLIKMTKNGQNNQTSDQNQKLKLTKIDHNCGQIAEKCPHQKCQNDQKMFTLVNKKFKIWTIQWSLETIVLLLEMPSGARLGTERPNAPFQVRPQSPCVTRARVGSAQRGPKAQLELNDSEQSCEVKFSFSSSNSKSRKRKVKW